ncbi:single-stranded DNA-binding protein [Streptacidiphilus carbonis]|uniref:single-stranded DNA-binding protein n=1 Tax=Streptacidiphilus carbonis TaxID=105422 RepID=UPI00191BD192|nr:single-stranded DNA-binding protein [Streptacidiphilus carbonis]
MSVGETTITIVGNLTEDPEIRFTPAGVAMARFTVASTPRTYDKTTNQWTDGTGMFLRCTAWRELAEHAADSLTKGTRVVLAGRLRQHNWKNEQGENRSMLQVEVDEIGPSLRWATAKVTKAQRNGTGNGFGGAPQDDPWNTSTPAKAPAPAVAGTGFSDEPPF